MKRFGRLIVRVIAPLAVVALGGGFAYRWWLSSEPETCDLLRRADVRTVFVTADARLSCADVQVKAAGPQFADALRQADPAALARLLEQERASALALFPHAEKGENLGARLSRLEFVEGLRGVSISPKLAVYALGFDVALSDRERQALSHVARAMFRGAREPSVTSFPSALRRVVRAEVMVTLSNAGDPRLWRSARGTSLSRALLTATRVARDRWRERETAMGGPLSERLSALDVEVSVLLEDGTLRDVSQAFVDRAITHRHGIGIDHRSDWYYLLPEAVLEDGKGSARRGLSSLLSERGLSDRAIEEPGARVYRFVPRLLSVSKALPRARPSEAGGVSE